VSTDQLGRRDGGGAGREHRVCIVGSGLAGMAAALSLARRGIPVTILEREAQLGGLARPVDLHGERIDAFYHFICLSDRDLLDLVADVGLGHKLHWRPCTTACVQDRRLYRFSSPLDLLRFAPVPLVERVRFGLNVLRCRYRNDWTDLDAVGAVEWLQQQVGMQAYDRIWRPLLSLKFGDHRDQVSAAWIWHRIHRIASSRQRIWGSEQHAYLEGGMATLLDRLESLLLESGVTILRCTPVTGIDTADGAVTGVITGGGTPRRIPCRHVFTTVAFPRLIPLLDGHPRAEAYACAVSRIDYIGVVCVLLRLNRRLTPYFWVNVNHPQVPINGFIEYTNLNRHFDQGRSHLVYIPFYVSASDWRYSQPEEALIEECCQALQSVDPRFERGWILESVVTRARYAQAICTVGFGARLPGLQVPLEGLLVSDSTQLYPEDRTMSGAIRLGRRAADEIIAAVGVVHRA
jgi:protoporphyrinogen oxidase